jgi:hypothetical protein
MSTYMMVSTNIPLNQPIIEKGELVFNKIGSWIEIMKMRLYIMAAGLFAAGLFVEVFIVLHETIRIRAHEFWWVDILVCLLSAGLTFIIVFRAAQSVFAKARDLRNWLDNVDVATKFKHEIAVEERNYIHDLMKTRIGFESPEGH